MAREERQPKEMQPMVVTDLDAIKENTEAAVFAFTQMWEPTQQFDLDVNIMDQAQLRDAMGLRATFESGDPWPAAEKLLIEAGYRWQWLDGQRVMFVKERDGYIEIDNS